MLSCIRKFKKRFSFILLDIFTLAIIFLELDLPELHGTEKIYTLQKKVIRQNYEFKNE